jgi:transcriptional regulator with XRE-family HTH domain
MRKSIYRRQNQVFLRLLRRYREQGKFRQRDLAQHLGSVQATVSKAETGTRRLDVIELREWLLAMGVDFLEFMTELHEQLQSASVLEPWLTARGELSSFTSTADRRTSSMAGKDRTAEGLAWKIEEGADGDLAPAFISAHVNGLAKRLMPLMRTGLAREANQTLRELGSYLIGGQPLSQWISRLHGAVDPDSAALLTPNDDDIRGDTHRLARVLLTNWFGLFSQATHDGRRLLVSGLRADPPLIPGEVAAGCFGFPVSDDEALRVLVTYLRGQWTPEWNSDDI